MKNIKRSLVVGLLAAVCSTAVLADELGLADRRALDAYQKGAYATLVKDIHKAATYNVPIEVKWEKVARAGEGSSYSDDAYFTNVYFVPLKRALTTVTADDMGKKALAAKLKKVVVTYEGAGRDDQVVFKGGTLTLGFQPYANPDEPQIQERAEQIQQTLEAGL